ncbi:MAG: alcohol dehydrogenase catalytic domain-containing protein [Proteobacteria bacterium]|nr:alcohol dehydrogenase catalytic domain-containing protein [Pseudomonadota bacterium]
MLAAILRSYGTPLVIAEIPRPEPRAGEVLVKVCACGVCGSDRFLQKGGFRSTLPIVPGHEASGVVAGGTITAFPVGTRVALYYLRHCGECRYCRTGRENVCASVQRMGVDFNGAMAEYVTLPAANLMPIPSTVDDISAAVVTDSLGTPLHALRVAEVQEGEVVLVIGIGGIGSSAIQIAKLLGARVIAASRSEAAADVAHAMGADDFIHCDVNLPRRVKEMTDGLGADIILQCAPSPEAFAWGAEALATGGRLVIVATALEPVPFNTNRLLWGEQRLCGSRGFTRADVIQALRWVEEGRLNVEHLTRTVLPLARANEALANLDRSDIVRSVLRP